MTNIRFFLILPLFASAQVRQSVPCIPLTSYLAADSEDELDIFLGGGDVPSDVPVFFDIPRMEVSGQVKLCIEDIPIPRSVGGTTCDEWSRCWLVIGTHTGTDLNPKDVEYCESSDAYYGVGPCYQCVCSGAEFSSGSVSNNETLSNACGLSSQEKWGTVCPDVVNGRMIYAENRSNPESWSNHSTVQINICDELNDHCSVCSGGYQPQFKVGLQWINVAEQCFDDPPFNSGHTIASSWCANVFSILVFIFVANIL